MQRLQILMRAYRYKLSFAQSMSDPEVETGCTTDSKRTKKNFPVRVE